MATVHKPAMLKEVMEYLGVKPGGIYIDCTLGGGGYARAIASTAGAEGKVIAIDLDEKAIEAARRRFAEEGLNNIILNHDNFSNLQEIFESAVASDRLDRVDGIVFDLGLSSDQLADRDRGFSFQLDAPLDMRFAQAAGSGQRTTEYIINKYSEKELIRIIREYGEEKFAGSIARAIAAARKKTDIKTTGELLEIIRQAVPAGYTRGRIHFATRTFQALRIATNDEMGNLESALPQAVSLLCPGGRLAVVSYHSLEDRIVKRYFRQESRACVCPPETPICSCGHEPKLDILTKRPLKPGAEEISVNPRARSAKLRVVEKK